MQFKITTVVGIIYYLIKCNTNIQLFNIEQNMHVKQMFWVTWQNIFFNCISFIWKKFQIYMYKNCISLILEKFGLFWLYVYIYFIYLSFYK